LPRPILPPPSFRGYLAIYLLKLRDTASAGASADNEKIAPAEGSDERFGAGEGEDLGYARKPRADVAFFVPGFADKVGEGQGAVAKPLKARLAVLSANFHLPVFFSAGLFNQCTISIGDVAPRRKWAGRGTDGCGVRAGFCLYLQAEAPLVNKDFERRMRASRARLKPRRTYILKIQR
jgi:hypothetical protein